MLTVSPGCARLSTAYSMLHGGFADAVSELQSPLLTPPEETTYRVVAAIAGAAASTNPARAAASDTRILRGRFVSRFTVLLRSTVTPAPGGVNGAIPHRAGV